MDFPILTLVGAGVGFFLGDKKDSVRNALLGAATGFAISFFSKKTSAQTPVEYGMATVEAEEELPTVEEQQGQPEDTAPLEDQNQGVSNVLVGRDYFPIGAVAHLANPYKTYTNRLVSEIKKFPNGNWLTQPVGEEYFTSVKKIVERGIDVGTIVDAKNQLLWSKEWGPANPLVAYAI